MNNQLSHKWEIDGIANAKYDVDSISWTSEGLVFKIIPGGLGSNEPSHKLLLIWESSSVVSYHVTDETYRSDCWGPDYQKNGRFFVTKTSKYINEMRNKSPLFPEEVIHFTIVGTNTIVDLIAKSYPELRNE